MFKQSVSYEAAYLAKFPSTDEDLPTAFRWPWNAMGATQEPDDSRTGRLSARDLRPPMRYRRRVGCRTWPRG